MGGDPTVQFEDSPVSTRVDDSQEENEACSREPIAISTQVESSTVSKAESNIIESNPSSRPSQTSGSQWKKTNYALEMSFDGPSLKRKGTINLEQFTFNRNLPTFKSLAISCFVKTVV